jgi:uncharacterized protein with PQ loop repeat
MGKYEPVMAMSGAIGLLSFFFLIKKVYKTQNTTSLDEIWLLGNFIAMLLNLFYGIVNNAYGIYVPSILFLIGTSYIIYIKYKTEYLSKAKKK